MPKLHLPRKKKSMLKRRSNCHWNKPATFLPKPNSKNIRISWMKKRKHMLKSKIITTTFKLNLSNIRMQWLRLRHCFHRRRKSMRPHKLRWTSIRNNFPRKSKSMLKLRGSWKKQRRSWINMLIVLLRVMHTSKNLNKRTKNNKSKSTILISRYPILRISIKDNLTNTKLRLMSIYLN